MNSFLITGGSGFFGRAFVRHLLANNMSDRICIYSRDEHKHAAIRDDLVNDPRLRFFIGDVRDKERLRRAMRDVDVVVAAAALKRIEVGRYDAAEMCKTNILGIMNTIEAATDTEVKKCVLISSDKAYQPVSVYGQTKAIAESLFLNANESRGSNGPLFSAVRYGNVWNSRGSVVPRWRQMIAEGKTTVPITDSMCTRFFMRIEEAVELVVNTIKTMQGGELNIPDLPAFRLGDLASAMNVAMDIKGLPWWEKLHESMAADKCSETARRMSVQELREALTHV